MASQDNSATEPEALRTEVSRLRQENAELRQRLGLAVAEPQPSYLSGAPELPLANLPHPQITYASPVQAKIALYRSLFRGREDVYAERWVNERTGKKGYSPACEDRWSQCKGQPRKYTLLTDQIVREHLSGTKTIGAFPLLKDNTCWFMACDFDKEGWRLDAVAYLEVCGRYGVQAYLERSRSGNGGHVWIFFSSPVSAVSARQIGMRFLRETMDVRGDLDLGSYDRFFPNQDFVPRGGFGNLIALPLQKKCRPLGNTEFLDVSTTELRPWPDQWAFLNRIQKVAPDRLEALLEVVPPVNIGPGRAESSPAAVRAKYPPPERIRSEFWSSLSIQKSGIPPWLLSKLKHLASMHNPEFYKMQRLRRSTHQLTRFIKCYREDFSHIHLPRGTFEEVRELVRQAGSELSCADRRQTPPKLSLKFTGSLRTEQKAAVEAALSREMGLLVAPPGAGKTVMGCYAIAERNLPTLVLAHRQHLLEQWREQLISFLDLASEQIGQLDGQRDRQTGIVDLAMIQSLARREDLGDFFSRYGFIVVDECHHLPAATFEACIREAPVRHILGLTATPYRRDQLQDIIYMQCGPILHRMAKNQGDPLGRLAVRETDFVSPYGDGDKIQELFRELVHDEGRNALIERDILAALKAGRRCLILSHWKEHCRLIADGLVRRGKNIFMLVGGQGKKERAAIIKAIQETPPEQDLVLVATGQYIGEGFDCPKIDTLFLVFPVAFKGKLVQYVGRILRDYPGKRDSIVYEYVDAQVPVLKKMHAKRLKAYKSIGFEPDGLGMEG
jgi:superfamily II DNA or RNA helicase